MYLCGFGTATISSLALAGLSNECGWPFYLSLLAASSHMAWILKSVNLGQRESCNRAFNDSQWTGMAVTAGITADMVLKAIHL
jgi:4-hydroxybenzoate polyprenyltransferase